MAVIPTWIERALAAPPVVVVSMISAMLRGSLFVFLSFVTLSSTFSFFFSFFSFDGKRKAIERAGLELNHSSNVSVFYSMFSSCSSVICVWCGASREGVILSIAIVSILLLPYPRRCSIYMLLPLPFVL